jgi:hypothetical protein
LEEGLVGEDGDGGGASPLVRGGGPDGIEVVREDAFAGGGFLHFRDDGGGFSGERGAEIAAAGRARGGLSFPLGERERTGKLFPFFGDNCGQYVWNRVGQRRFCYGIAGRDGPASGYKRRAPIQPASRKRLGDVVKTIL